MSAPNESPEQVARKIFLITMAGIAAFAVLTVIMLF